MLVSGSRPGSAAGPEGFGGPHNSAVAVHLEACLHTSCLYCGSVSSWAPEFPRLTSRHMLSTLLHICHGSEFPCGDVIGPAWASVHSSSNWSPQSWGWVPACGLGRRFSEKQVLVGQADSPQGISSPLWDSVSFISKTQRSPDILSPCRRESWAPPMGSALTPRACRPPTSLTVAEASDSRARSPMILVWELFSRFPGSYHTHPQIIL